MAFFQSLGARVSRIVRTETFQDQWTSSSSATMGQRSAVDYKPCRIKPRTSSEGLTQALSFVSSSAGLLFLAQYLGAATSVNPGNSSSQVTAPLPRLVAGALSSFSTNQLPPDILVENNPRNQNSRTLKRAKKFESIAKIFFERMAKGEYESALDLGKRLVCLAERMPKETKTIATAILERMADAVIVAAESGSFDPVLYRRALGFISRIAGLSSASAA